MPRPELTAQDAALRPPLLLGNPALLQGLYLGCEFHQTHRKRCGALFNPTFQVSSWRSPCSSAVWGGWEVAQASRGSRMQLPCPVELVAVPEAVPLLQPRVLPLLGLLQVRYPQLTTENIEPSQTLLHFCEPDSQSPKSLLHCEINESQGEFWQ